MSLDERRATDSAVLAVLRTELANRRTLLAYVKTFIGLLASGLAVLHFIDEGLVYRVVGVLLVVSSGFALLLGALYYRRTKREIEAERLDCGLPPTRSLT